METCRKGLFKHVRKTLHVYPEMYLCPMRITASAHLIVAMLAAWEIMQPILRLDVLVGYKRSLLSGLRIIKPK